MRAVAALRRPMVTRMAKLTSEDIRTVETFLASPMGVRFADGLAAQTYEPRGAGYQPSTDTRLAALVLRGVRPGKSAWTIASCVIDQLCGRPGGGAHLDVIRRYGRTADRAAVGAHVPRAMAYGHHLAKDAARMLELEAEYRSCQWAKRSSFETTARILDLDAKLCFRPIDVSVGAIQMHASFAIADGLINVDAEIDALLDAAADAMHAARERVHAAEHAARERENNRRATLRAELAGKSPRANTATKRKAKRAAQLLVECLELAAAS